MGGAFALAAADIGRRVVVLDPDQAPPDHDPRVFALSRASENLLLKDCVYDGDMPIQAAVDPTSLEIRVTEAFAYPKLGIFAVQHHPEWQTPEHRAWNWTLEHTRRICFGEGEETLLQEEAE